MKASTKADREPAGLEELAIKRLAGEKPVALNALVAELAGELGCSVDRVTEGLMGLQARNRIVISERSPRASFASYASSPRSLWFWAAAGAALLSLVFLLATSGLALYLRYAFGGLLVLFLPGFSLIELLYYKKELDELTRFALSLGLSLAMVPLVGLVLNYTPFGIRLLPVALSLAGLTMVFLTLALRSKYAYYEKNSGR